MHSYVVVEALNLNDRRQMRELAANGCRVTRLDSTVGYSGGDRRARQLVGQLRGIDHDHWHPVATRADRSHLGERVLRLGLARHDGEIDVLLKRALSVVVHTATWAAVLVGALHDFVALGRKLHTQFAGLVGG